jgi:hypothetical protein
MNIKSLLLGSAAALVAVSGARAADVIMPVAPEPVDYVRVCDVYGTGFYYIPGTETCLAINGYVRFQYNVVGDTATENDEGDDYQAGSQVRVRLNFDAREETELGTLRAFLRIQATNTFGLTDQVYSMDQGYLQLGGLTMGYTDSLFTEGDGLLTDEDQPVGDIQVNRVSYTYAANGFSAALSLEDDATGDFAPDVVGRLAYAGGWGSVYVAGVYDENTDDLDYASPFLAGTPDFTNADLAAAGFTPAQAALFGGYFVGENSVGIFGLNPNDNGDGAFALKAGLSLQDLIAADSELKIEGSYAFDPTRYSTNDLFANVASLGLDDNSLFGNVPVEWQIGAGYAQQFGKLGVAVSGTYGETFEFFGDLNSDGVLDSVGQGEYYRLVGNVGYEITNNFDMLGELRYTNMSFDDVAGDDEIDQTAGFLRFVRSF